MMQQLEPVDVKRRILENPEIKFEWTVMFKATKYSGPKLGIVLISLFLETVPD